MSPDPSNLIGNDEITCGNVYSTLWYLDAVVAEGLDWATFHTSPRISSETTKLPAETSISCASGGDDARLFVPVQRALTGRSMR
jgi:hypothetical protein